MWWRARRLVLGLLLSKRVAGRDMVILVGCCLFFPSLVVHTPLYNYTGGGLCRSQVWLMVSDILRLLLVIHSGSVFVASAVSVAWESQDVSWPVFVISESAAILQRESS